MQAKKLSDRSKTADRVPVNKDFPIGDDDRGVNVMEPVAPEHDYPRRASRSLGWVRLLWSRRQFLARATVFAFVLTFIAVFLVPKRYTSTTRLMPPDSQKPSLGLGMLAAGGGALSSIISKTGGLGALAGDMLGLQNSGSLFVGLLRSRTVEDHIVSKYDLRKVYWVSRWEQARKELEKRTDVSVDTKSGIITIQVTDSSPDRAAGMAAEYVAELNDVVTQVNTSSAHRERVFLEGRLQEVKQDLEDAEKEFSVFASKNTAIDIKEQGKAMVGAAASLQGELIAAETELEGLKQIYTTSNVRVKTAEARVLELQRAMQKLGGTGEATDINNDSFYPSIRKLPLLGVTYADLYRRTAVNEATFEALTQQYELAKVEEAKDVPSVKVVDPADRPEMPSFPPLALTIVLGTLCATVLAAGWIIGNQMWEEADPNSPGKIFAQELLTDLSHTRLFHRNGRQPMWAVRENTNGTSDAVHDDRL